MYTNNKNLFIKKDTLNTLNALSRLYDNKKNDYDEIKISPSNKKKKENSNVTINVKDYMKILNSIDSFKKKVNKELEKFDSGLNKINYMNQTLENYKKIKKDLKKIHASSSSNLNSIHRTNFYFCSRPIERTPKYEFISDSDSSKNSSYDYLKDKFEKKRSIIDKRECKTSRDNYRCDDDDASEIFMNIYDPNKNFR